MSFNRLKRKVIAWIAPKNKLERELFYLRRKMKRVEKLIEWYIDQPFTCCHYCAYPELMDLEDHYTRQMQHDYYLECKIARMKYGH